MPIRSNAYAGARFIRVAQMNHLTRHDYAAALQLLGRVEAFADDIDAFTGAVVAALSDYVACESAVVTVCEERCAQQDDLGPGLHLVHAIAVPLQQDAHTDPLVAIVLNRRKPGFGDRDRERLDLLRPHLAFLYGHARRMAARGATQARVLPHPPPLPNAPPCALTLRERDVLQWLTCGKTDADIAALLAISPRTVHKHLEHIYVKLGVETRTAAVMRVLGGHPGGGVEVQAVTPG